MNSLRFEEAYMQSERADKEDTFLQAFGNKPGADRRKQRRQRKGWEA